jgi:response regulator RpfG family c-di-GMP phosphodiesterase
MSKKTSKHNSHAVLLMDATQEEFTRLREEMSGWLCLGEDRLFDLSPKPASHSIDVIIVFAHKDRENRALDICTRICEKKAMESVPLFIAGNRYQMNLAHKVKRLPQVDFIFTPIDKDELLDKMKKHVNVSSSEE